HRLVALPERLAGGDDRVVALPPGPAGEVRVGSGPGPVAAGGLGFERGLHAALPGGAVAQAPGHPDVVGDLYRAGRADLAAPRAAHQLGVDAGDLQAGGEAAVEVQLDDVAAEHGLGADAAVVVALRGGEAALGEAERTAALEEGVLLLDAEPRVLL